MKILKKILKILLFLLILSALILLILYIYVKKNPIDIKTNNSYYIYDHNKKLVNSISDEWITLDNISQNLIDATISIEDKNFYSHHGFDYLRIIKSLYVNVVNKDNLQGASTITQQYAKNLFLDFNKTWKRKFKEAWFTFKLEANYSKDEILEGYLNTINYGNVYGIENASHYYFNKSAKDLTLAEASMLAGIPNSPNNYSPLVNEEKAKKRQKAVLNSMVKNKYITKQDADNAYNTNLTYYGHLETNNSNTIMYYQSAVMEELKSIETIPKSILETGGLKIYTYLDMDAQLELENNINDYITNEEIEVASVMMNPNNGGIIALIGGKNYKDSQFNRATQAKRQVGSTIKPFLYYTALENGFTASTTFTSEKTTFLFDNDKTYSPQNYNDKYGNKEISMATALAYSDNIYAVKTHLFLGEDALLDTLKRVGITAKLKANPSLALGSGEVNLLEMTSAYATLANTGYKVTGHFIKKVEDMDGNVLYEYDNKKDKILNSSITYILSELLTSTYNYNFIDYNYPTCYDITEKLTNKYAIKTGTTDTDHLIFGYNKNVVLGIWSGYDDSKESEVSDGKPLRYIWADTMEEYLKDKKVKWYKTPDNVVGVIVDPISGKPTTDNNKATMFYYIKGTEPNYEENLDTLIPTVKETTE